ncbi:hypothetical protein HMPREF0494_0716 [Limosilactobacillus antri DSM 16041]|uniref:Uncharacterized protein n=1 Tax=Limosilactobacillus antri DSM 16041 TaxID=525309 RepID=C8P5X2_9LACO|nr:hypothetical protein HMPREF0494_0716 [Limosilactobacillus antri DSM 16041]
MIEAKLKGAGEKTSFFLTSLLLVLNYYKDNVENNHKASV